MLFLFIACTGSSIGRITVFPRIIAGDDYSAPFFAQKRGDYSRDGDFSTEGDYSRKAIISNIAHWKSCPKYFVLFHQ